MYVFVFFIFFPDVFSKQKVRQFLADKELLKCTIKTCLQVHCIQTIV